MKYQVVLIICLSWFFRFSVVAQLTKTDIDKAIDISSLKHPYLYFTEEEKPELLNRIKNSQECNDIFQKLEATAQMCVITSYSIHYTKLYEEHGRESIMQTFREKALNTVIILQTWSYNFV